MGPMTSPSSSTAGAWRFLHFGLDTVQSAMRLDDPDRLSLRYTRKMMAFLLFNRAPERILLLGLGGGSLAKFCYRRLPAPRSRPSKSIPTSSRYARNSVFLVTMLASA